MEMRERLHRRPVHGQDHHSGTTPSSPSRTATSPAQPPRRAVYRGDTSGTTLLATTFLSRASEGWETIRGRHHHPMAARGRATWNDGVAETVETTPGAIG